MPTNFRVFDTNNKMEIDKDRVVEAARAYVERMEYLFKSVNERPENARAEYFALQQALNPPPPRPSKEECIEWLGKVCAGGITADFQRKYQATIEYLKEPSNLQWIKNTGVKPDYQYALIKFEDGDCSYSHTSNLHDWNTPNLEGRTITKYIILE